MYTDLSPPNDSPRVVLKFGGSSVSSAQDWESITELVRTRLAAGERLLIVHSALSGVTDHLERLPELAIRGRADPAVDSLAERHFGLARDLGLDGPRLLDDELTELRRSLEGIALTQEAPPRVRARILACGERLSTRIGSAALRARGLPVEWLDSGELLAAIDTGRQTGSAVWLSAECDSRLDPRVRDRLDAVSGIGLTQGFAARNERGDTVVLGRGGSDTSAAYLAGKWGAARLEVWSDVPGMFSADPRLLDSARLLRSLDYPEAQEIATTGGRVLHPRAVRALRDRGIPIYLKSTRDPEAPGTVIARARPEGPGQVKAISWKREVVLVSMETLGMWQEVGFLARAFATFRELGLSIDLVSTSESNVTVSLDPNATLLDDAVLTELTDRLSRFCGVQVIRPCAAVSLVGHRIRGLLHRMGPALEAFEDRRVHLVSQAASDLNFTVVVDEDQARGLVLRLHDLLIPASTEDAPGSLEVFGPSWLQLQSRAEESSRSK